MESVKAPINRIIEFSNVDGPGNRTSIFVQKCPFRCLYCHNPETIHMCVNCGVCVSKCPVQALEMVDGKVVWDEKKCVQCDTCIHVCPNLASPKVHVYSARDVVEKIQDYFPYIEGITVSGGECSLYEEFLTELFTLVHKENKTCFMDSNGNALYEEMEELMAVTDAVMLDVKASVLEDHLWLTGIENQNVLRNLEWLQRVGKLYEVRTVCLPNASKMNEATVRYVASHLDPSIRYKLIKYRPFGVREEGLEKLGHSITSDEEILRLKKIAEEAGLKNVVIV